jgi:hypothetical protein
VRSQACETKPATKGPCSRVGSHHFRTASLNRHAHGPHSSSYGSPLLRRKNEGAADHLVRWPAARWSDSLRSPWPGGDAHVRDRTESMARGGPEPLAGCPVGRRRRGHMQRSGMRPQPVSRAAVRSSLDLQLRRATRCCTCWHGHAWQKSLVLEAVANSLDALGDSMRAHPAIWPCIWRALMTKHACEVPAAGMSDRESPGPRCDSVCQRNAGMGSRMTSTSPIMDTSAYSSSIAIHSDPYVRATASTCLLLAQACARRDRSRLQSRPLILRYVQVCAAQVFQSCAAHKENAPRHAPPARGASCQASNGPTDAAARRCNPNRTEGSAAHWEAPQGLLRTRPKSSASCTRASGSMQGCGRRPRTTA